MPKVKTHSGCKKRFKKNCNGKIKRARAFRRHHSWAKTHKKVRKLRAGTYIGEEVRKKIATLLP
jgi:large subunit ribosomal protein L35